jgi:5-formyltetrahydrofolate cyclo-ligase
MEVAGEKAALRKNALAAMRGMSPGSRVEGSAQACARLLERPEWQRAQSILFYAPLPEELNIWPLLEAALSQGKMAGLPCFDPATGGYFARRVCQPERDVLIGQFGIREPSPICPELPLNLLDLVLVPGVAFDEQGYRLGRGKGFYDRLLRNLRGTTCGVAFEQQMTLRVPLEPHDVGLNCILTPARWIPIPPPVLK